MDCARRTGEWRSSDTSEATFALADSGRIVHVSEVPRGRACHCVCAACRLPVIAKKGTRNAWHFAHDSTHNCNSAPETALHLAVKQIIVEGDVLAVPEFVVEETATVKDHTRSAERILPARRIHYVNPRLEVRLNEIVADAVVTSGQRDLIVEVAVTHKVDDAKRAKILLLGASALELEAWRLPRNADWTALTAFVRETFSDRIWVHNSRESVQRQLAYLKAQNNAKIASDSFDRLQAAMVANDRASRVRMESTVSQSRGAVIDKFHQLWARFGTGTLVFVDLDAQASMYVARWSQADAAGDPSAYFDLLVEWICQKTRSIVRTEAASE